MLEEESFRSSQEPHTHPEVQRLRKKKALVWQADVPEQFQPKCGSGSHNSRDQVAYKRKVQKRMQQVHTTL